METISSKQTELDTFIADGYKTALSEERRRYCFLVDRQCAVAKNSSAYHGKVRSLNYYIMPFWVETMVSFQILTFFHSHTLIGNSKLVVDMNGSLN